METFKIRSATLLVKLRFLIMFDQSPLAFRKPISARKVRVLSTLAADCGHGCVDVAGG